MIDLMRHGRMLAEAVREKARLEREISVVQARINTLSAEISASMMSALDEPGSEHVNCPHDPEGADGNPFAPMICAPMPDVTEHGRTSPDGPMRLATGDAVRRLNVVHTPGGNVVSIISSDPVTQSIED